MRIDNVSKIILHKPSAPKPTRGELRLSSHINENIEAKNAVLLSKHILERINNLIVLNNSPNTALIDLLSRLGKSVTDTVLRKIFITEFAGKNTFYLSLYEHALKSEGAKPILKAFNFKKLIGDKNGENSYSTALKNRFYSMIAIIYSSASIETVEKVLKPLLTKTLIKCDDIFVTNFFKKYLQLSNKNIDINIDKSADNLFEVTSKFEDKILKTTSELSAENAILELYKKIIAIKKLYPYQNFIQHNKKTKPTKEVRELVENILLKTGFKETSETINTRVFNPYDYILNALSPQKRLELMSINHQKFEFYGDAVCNMLTERFLLEKRLDDKLRNSSYKKITANQTLAEFFDKINLDAIINNGKNMTEKEKADIFEAFIGALHISYPEKKIYEYLHPLLNAKYEEIINNIQ